MVRHLSSSRSPVTIAGTHGDQLVATPEISLAWAAENRHRFSLCASLLAAMEGMECSLLQGRLNQVNDLLLLIKTEADQWIQVGANGLGCLASGQG